LNTNELMMLLSNTDVFSALEFVKEELYPSTFLSVLLVVFTSVKFEAKTEEFTKSPLKIVVLMMIMSVSDALITVELNVLLWVWFVPMRIEKLTLLMLINVESVTLAENTKELDMLDPASTVLCARESKWIESVMLALIAVLFTDVKLTLRISRTVEFKMYEPE